MGRAATVAVTVALDVLSGLIGASFAADHGRLSLHAPASSGLALAALGPVFHLTVALAIALAIALLAATFRHGRLSERFAYLLKPWMLAQVPIGIAGLMYSLIAPPASLLGLGGGLWQYVPLSLSAGLSLLFLGYTVDLALAALRVGAYRFRMAAAITLVAVVTWLVVGYAFVAFERALGLHA